MPCVDLKECFGKKYRIGHDPAAEIEPGGMHDPWLYTIRCQFGEIYPYGREKLAFHCTGTIIRQKIKEAFPDMEVSNWSDDGEAIFIFHVDRLLEIAKFAKPRRKRQVSESERQRLAELSRKFSPFTSTRDRIGAKKGGGSGGTPIGTEKS